MSEPLLERIAAALERLAPPAPAATRARADAARGRRIPPRRAAAKGRRGAGRR